MLAGLRLDLDFVFHKDKAVIDHCGLSITNILTHCNFSVNWMQYLINSVELTAKMMSQHVLWVK